MAGRQNQRSSRLDLRQAAAARVAHHALYEQSPPWPTQCFGHGERTITPTDSTSNEGTTR